MVTLPASGPHEFAIEAYISPSLDFDEFIFAYSEDDSTYIDLLTVSNFIDDDIVQTATIPDSVTGDIYIRVLDTNRTATGTAIDYVYIDRMYVQSGVPSSEVLLGFDHISTPSLVVSPEIPAVAGTPPSADAGPDQSGLVNYDCTFDGSGTTEPDGDPMTYEWTFTYDGSPQVLSGINPTFLFEIPGSYEVTLTAGDKDGTDTDVMW